MSAPDMHQPAVEGAEPHAAAPSAGPVRHAVPAPAADDRLALRAALGRYATGVTIITCLNAEGRPVGLTANSFSALSLEPPLVLWSLRRASSVLATFAAAPVFAVNVLSQAQVELSRRFASREADKFAQGVWRDGLGGAPVLEGSAATFECTLVSQQTAGDHVLFIGEVLHHRHDTGEPALAFHAGHYHAVGERL